MTLHLATIAGAVRATAEAEGLWLRRLSPGPGLDRRTGWPIDARRAPGGEAVAMQVELALELGFARSSEAGVVVPYTSFSDCENEGIDLTSRWSDWSPLLLKIDRSSDLGRPDFRYEYEFLRGSRPVSIQRVGYFVLNPVSGKIWRLDRQTWALVEAMDHFNSLLPEQKTRRESWLAFATVKGCASEVGASLDDALLKNDVVVPSRLGLQMHVDPDGSLSFAPRCEGVDDERMKWAFFHNPNAEGLYSISTGAQERIRVVLDDNLQEVVRRMQGARKLRGTLREDAERDPECYFDGVLDHVNVTYGPRVTGVGEFEPVAPGRNPASGTEIGSLLEGRSGAQPADRPLTLEAQGVDGSPVTVDLPDDEARRRLIDVAREAMAHGRGSIEWEGKEIRADSELVTALETQPRAAAEGGPRKGKYLLIHTNEQDVGYEVGPVIDASARGSRYRAPAALGESVRLQGHQIEGVGWLQGCLGTDGRRGGILADDMGLGKTLQVLTFIAWCIESGRIAGLDRPPYRPVLIVSPLILVENQTWAEEMRRFFRHDGVIFQPFLTLYGSEVRKMRAEKSGERELTAGRPVLDIDKLRENRVVITNYDTVKNYQHSFACEHDGQGLWSLVVTDEAQEYKTPSSQISHAIKALAPRFHVACTGTPVENRLVDLWNIMDCVQPGRLGAAREFESRFELPVAQGDASALEALRKRLLFRQENAFLLRREKTSVADLPPKTIHRIACPMTAEESDIHRSLTGGEGGASGHHFAALHDLVKLSQHAAMLSGGMESVGSDELVKRSPKLKAVITELHRIRGLREKAILFCRHCDMQQALARVLAAEFGIDVHVINGKTRRSHPTGTYDSISARATRQEILRSFKAKPGFNLLILSPFVAGIGLTITEANHVFHYGRWWNPAVEAQATDRAYRIGQTKEVHVYLPILTGHARGITRTFDEALDALMTRKQRLAADFLRPTDSEESCGAELWEDIRSSGGSGASGLTIEEADQLAPVDFEALVAALFSRGGAVTVLTAKGNDGGADVVSVSPGRFTVIQVKHSSRGAGIGADALDDVLSAGNTYGARLRMSPSLQIITNTYPQRELLEECRLRGVKLVAREQLAKMMQEHPITRGELAAAAARRCGSFQEGVRRVEAALS